MSEQVTRQIRMAWVPCAPREMGVYHVRRTAITVVQLYTASSRNPSARIKAGKGDFDGSVDYDHVTFEVVPVREARLAEVTGKRSLGFDGFDPRPVLFTHVSV